MTAGTPGFDWTAENVERLKTMWADGLSASQCAGEFRCGLSRSAVIGKVHRLGLSGRVIDRPRGLTNASVPRIRATKQRTPRLPVSRNYPILGVVDAAPPPPSIDDLAIPIEQRLGILDLRQGRCRWPVGHPGEPGFFFCGGRAAPDQPYCAGHCARAFNAEPPRSRAYRGRFTKYGTRVPDANVVAAG